MIRKLPSLVKLFFVTIFIFIGFHAHAETQDDLLNQKNAIVNIHVHDEDGKLVASGGGFVVDPDGIIATNCNVIVQWLKKIPNTLIVEFKDGEKVPIEDLISTKCINNLALIKVKKKGLSPIMIDLDYKPKKGEPVFILGSLSEPESTVSNGVIKNIFKNGKLIQISIPVLPEKSGSPLFNIKGQAIGALTYLQSKSKNRHYAVSLKNIVKQLTKYTKREYKVVKKIHHKSITPIKKPEKTIKKPDDAKELFIRGCSYHKLNMFENAISLYKEAINKKHDYWEAFLNLGVAYYKIGKYTDAIEAFKIAAKINPSSSIYNKLGSAYIINGNYPLALKSFKKSLDLDPKNPVAHYNLGIAYYLNGNRTAAFKEYSILKEIDMERAKSLLDLIY